MTEPSVEETRPTKDELYAAMVELQSSAADYVHELEEENYWLWETLKRARRDIEWFKKLPLIGLEP